jgi:hypothetical protein
MNTRYFALVLGIIFLVVGVMGFIPAFVTHPAMTGTMAAGPHAAHGYLLGLFPVNTLHNIVHLLFGLWGVFAYADFHASRVYARSVCIIYAILAIMGLIPGANTVWGLIPLHSNDVWLHAVIALAAAYFGFAPVREPTLTTRDTVTDTGTGDYRYSTGAPARRPQDGRAEGKARGHLSVGISTRVTCLTFGGHARTHPRPLGIGRRRSPPGRAGGGTGAA